MVIHALVDHGNTQVKARCGETVEIKSGNTKLPEGFSTWFSDVTCSACREGAVAAGRHSASA